MILGRYESFLGGSGLFGWLDGCSGWLWVIVKFFRVVVGRCGLFHRSRGGWWVVVRFFLVVVGCCGWFGCNSG